jgi:hypothetical protein
MERRYQILALGITDRRCELPDGVKEGFHSGIMMDSKRGRYDVLTTMALESCYYCLFTLNEKASSRNSRRQVAASNILRTALATKGFI